MEIQFYKNTAEINRVDKTNYLTLVSTNEGSFVSSEDMLQPILRVRDTNNIAPTINYIYIPNLQRYYFVDSVQLVNNGIIDYKLKVDVLMSFKSKILSQTAYIERNENEFNKYLVDNNIVSSCKKEYAVVEIVNTFFDVKEDASDRYIITLMNDPGTEITE